MYYTLEEVRWVDDTDFMQLRCPSLGPRCMRGFEMFTIGDCQSILLKLTNERCMQLREELNDATARQIEAEELMKEEADTGFDAIFEKDCMMTDAEMTYLAAMEEVKTVSKQLVIAERAFQLVRDRIEKLVAKYEALLVRIEAESECGSASVGSFDDSDEYSDEYDCSSQYDSEEEDREKEMLARRAQRAELKAEVAAREAMLAKQEAEKIKEEKQRELEILQQRLAELQSETRSMAEREHSLKLATAFAPAGSASGGSNVAGPRDGGAGPVGTAKSSLQGERIDQNKIDGVKQKFRDRMAERMRRGPPSTRRHGFEGGGSSGAALTSPTGFDPSLGGGRMGGAGPGGEGTSGAGTNGRPPRDVPRSRQRLTGEEMFQHLDFYERSLKAVENTSERKY